MASPRQMPACFAMRLSFFLLAFAAVIFGVIYVGMCKAPYRQLYRSGVIDRSAASSEAAYLSEIDVFHAFLRGKDPFPSNGYTERERAHMLDVRLLYRRAKVTAAGAALIGVMLLISAVRSRRPRWRDALLPFVALAGLAGGAALFFEPLFTMFHRLLFPNDLWLLPENAKMIRLLPEEVFLRIAVQGILAGSAVYGFVCSAIIATCARRGFCRCAGF